MSSPTEILAALAPKLAEKVEGEREAYALLNLIREDVSENTALRAEVAAGVSEGYHGLIARSVSQPGESDPGEFYVETDRHTLVVRVEVLS